MDQEKSHPSSSEKNENNEKFKKIQEFYERYYVSNDESSFLS